MNYRIALPLACALAAVSAGCSKPNPPASTETPAADSTMTAPATDPSAPDGTTSSGSTPTTPPASSPNP